MNDSVRPAKTGFRLDRYTAMGDLTLSVRAMLKRSRIGIGAALGGAATYMFFTGKAGAPAFSLMAAGTFISLLVWSQKGLGLPLLPMLTIEHLVLYGLPILSQHADVHRYSADMLTAAGVDVFVFLIAMTGTWRAAMEMMRPSPAIAYALLGIDREGVKGLSRLAIGLVIGSTGFLVLQSMGAIDFVYAVLPNGSYPIFWAAVSATSACGFFLMSMIIGSSRVKPWLRMIYWTLLTLNCFISAAGFLLSGAATTTCAVVIGFLWGTGKFPVRFTIALLVILSFLNLGKFTMRERYWHHGDDDLVQASNQRLLDMPAVYSEWAVTSYESLMGDDTPKLNRFGEEIKTVESQSLLDRVNNLQNLLYVMDVMKQGVPALHGATYTLIPPLLVPRIIWPDKPRSHEGQVLLNTHFGRQDLRATFQTYIAWGLLPEAYGNFGPIGGAIFLGVFLGGFCAWLENITARKPVLSAEGFIAFVIFLGVAGAYEMVASVMITSIFQSLVPVAFACAPFVKRMVITRPQVATT